MTFRVGALAVLCLPLLFLSGSSIAGSSKATQTAYGHDADCYENYDELFSSYTIRDENTFKTAAAFASDLESRGIDSDNILAIYSISKKTKVNFDLLLLKAIIESGLGENLIAANSSARGLFQYIEQTWLALMMQYGSEAGFPEYASKIYAEEKTRILKVRGGTDLREKILDLRDNPYLSSYLKAMQIIEETGKIKAMKKKGEVTETDHYLSHLLGLRLAGIFYKLLNSDSKTAVADADPAMQKAAALNKWFFYDKDRALTAKEVYERAEKRVQQEISNISATRKLTGKFCVGPKLISLASIE